MTRTDWLAVPTSAAPIPGAERKRRARRPKKRHLSPESESMESSEIREGTEDSECCAEKKGHAKCSACAAGKPCSGRGDALTAQDYLDACDLGISDRSRPYIRARLDAMSTRNDLRTPGTKGKKCGNSYIPANATCNNGQGSAAQGAAKPKMSRTRRVVGTLFGAGAALSAGGKTVEAIHHARKGRVGMAAARAVGAVAEARAARHYMQGRIGRGMVSELKGGAAELGIMGASLAAKSPRARRAAYGAGMRAGQAAQGARRRAGAAGARAAEFFGRRNARRGAYRTTARSYGGPIMPYGRRDSVWALGFEA